MMKVKKIRDYFDDERTIVFHKYFSKKKKRYKFRSNLLYIKIPLKMWNDSQ